MKKISLPYFISENRQKSGFSQYTLFLKKYFDKFWKKVKNLKENVMKVLKAKPHEPPEVYMLKNTLEAVGGYIDIVGLDYDVSIKWWGDFNRLGKQQERCHQYHRWRFFYLRQWRGRKPDIVEWKEIWHICKNFFYELQEFTKEEIEEISVIGIIWCPLFYLDYSENRGVNQIRNRSWKDNVNNNREKVDDGFKLEKLPSYTLFFWFCMELCGRIMNMSAFMAYITVKNYIRFTAIVL